MMLNDKDKLKYELGHLKYLKEKYNNNIGLIDKYIYRIEENISDVKCADTYKKEELKNKDLAREVECLLQELEGVKDE